MRPTEPHPVLADPASARRHWLESAIEQRNVLTG